MMRTVLAFLLLLPSFLVEAKEWVSGEMVIGYPPLYMDEHQSRRGIYSDLGRAIYQRAGIDHKINYYNSPRMQRDYWRTRLDIMCCNNPGWWKSDQAWDLSLFSIPVWSIREYWIFPIGVTFDPQTELDNKMLALISGFGYRGIDEAKIIRIDLPSTQKIMGHLDRQQADASILQEAVFYWEKQHGDFDLELGPLQDEVPVHVMVHPNARELMPRINQAIREMQADGSIDAIIHSYRSSEDISH